MAPLWSLLVLASVASFLYALEVPHCSEEEYDYLLTDEQRYLVAREVLKQPPFQHAEKKARYKCYLENDAGEYLAEGDKRVCWYPFLCLYYQGTESGLTFPKFFEKAMEAWKSNFTTMEKAYQVGCNHRKGEDDQEMACFIKLVKDAP